MRFLTRLATGDFALWFTFWLIGTPIALVWDLSGGCMVAGCGIGHPLIAGSFIVLFTLSCVAVIFASVAIWRSSTNYPREAWWRTALAIAAKLCAALSGFAAALSFLTVIYFLYTFIRAGEVPF